VTTPAVRRVRVVGGGRAAGAFARALEAVGVVTAQLDGRSPEVAAAAEGVDLVLVCVSDGAVAEVAVRVRPDPAVVVAHVSGSLGLDVLAPHPRVAALHPLASLPSAEVGATVLRAGTTFAVAGDPLARAVVERLGGRAVEVADADRAAYHAAACIASNHTVALLGQVERVAASVGLPLAAFRALVEGSVTNAFELGPAAALTGPAARGDEATLDRHRAALDPSELAAYEAMVAEARRLAGTAS